MTKHENMTLEVALLVIADGRSSEARVVSALAVVQSATALLTKSISHGKARLVEGGADRKIESSDGTMVATVSKVGEGARFDTKAFKAEQPAMYAKYRTRFERAPSVTLKVAK